MIYLMQVGTIELRTAILAHPRLGQLAIPGNRNKVMPGVVWAADNGAFTGSYPGDAGYLEWLEARREHAGRCLFAAAPDVMGDWRATLQVAEPMLEQLRAAGWPAALVAQDGLEASGWAGWEQLDVLFLGGTTEWKLGPGAAALAAEAQERGKAVHMGRVNSGKRFRYADALGCASADGTFVVRAPRENLVRMRGWLDEALPLGDA